MADALQLIFDPAVDDVPLGIAHICTMPVWETAELLTFVHQVLSTNSVRWAASIYGCVSWEEGEGGREGGLAGPGKNMQ
jgi:hypothetical protein